METKIEYLEYDCDRHCDGDAENKKGKNTSPVTVVLKVDLHCDGCISRIVRLARSLEGVETVRADPSSNKLTLIGFMDPVKITEKLQKKSKKKIELISPKPKPKPKKETKGNNDTKADKQTQTMVAVSTVILKLSCSCDGCTKRIHKTISKTKGVYQVKMDKEKELVTVTGTMEVKSVTENVKRKLKKTVQVVPEKKKKDKENKTEENTKAVVAPPGFGHYGYMEGTYTELFSEEDGTFCSVM